MVELRFALRSCISCDSWIVFLEAWTNDPRITRNTRKHRRDIENADALSALWKCYPGLRDRIATEQGQIREHINVFVGDENIQFTGGLTTRVAEGSEISIVPNISGGGRSKDSNVRRTLVCRS